MRLPDGIRLGDPPPEQPMCGASPLPWILLAAEGLGLFCIGAAILTRCAG